MAIQNFLGNLIKLEIQSFHLLQLEIELLQHGKGVKYQEFSFVFEIYLVIPNKTSFGFVGNPSRPEKIKNLHS
jgi:hypothetical protein